jgi:hypothetical protein
MYLPKLEGKSHERGGHLQEMGARIPDFSLVRNPGKASSPSRKGIRHLQKLNMRSPKPLWRREISRLYILFWRCLLYYLLYLSIQRFAPAFSQSCFTNSGIKGMTLGLSGQTITGVTTA